MRYTELIERRLQKTQIMYHGTSSNLVRSILKNGLLARPPRKTYDVDTYGTGTASMGGVYISPDRGFAETIAQEAVGTHGGKPAMVTLQYVLGSGDTDEDEITQHINDAVNYVIKQLGQKAPDDAEEKYSGLSYWNEGWAVDYMIENKQKMSSAIAKKSVDLLAKYAKVRRVVEPIIQQIVLNLLNHAGQESEYRDRWNLLRFESYTYVREYEEQLLAKLMKQISVDGAGGHNEGARRLDRDVKFKGKTRILKIEVGNKIVYQDPTFK
jgi:hypothetical protein